MFCLFLGSSWVVCVCMLDLESRNQAVDTSAAVKILGCCFLTFCLFSANRKIPTLKLCSMYPSSVSSSRNIVIFISLSNFKHWPFYFACLNSWKIHKLQRCPGCFRVRTSPTGEGSTMFTAPSRATSLSLTTWRAWRSRRRSTRYGGCLSRTPPTSCSPPMVSRLTTHNPPLHQRSVEFITYTDHSQCSIRGRLNYMTHNSHFLLNGKLTHCIAFTTINIQKRGRLFYISNILYLNIVQHIIVVNVHSSCGVKWKEETEPLTAVSSR